MSQNDLVSNPLGRTAAKIAAGTTALGMAMPLAPIVLPTVAVVGVAGFAWAWWNNLLVPAFRGTGVAALMGTAGYAAGRVAALPPKMRIGLTLGGAVVGGVVGWKFGRDEMKKAKEAHCASVAGYFDPRCYFGDAEDDFAYGGDWLTDLLPTSVKAYIPESVKDAYRSGKEMAASGLDKAKKYAADKLPDSAASKLTGYSENIWNEADTKKMMVAPAQKEAALVDVIFWLDLAQGRARYVKNTAAADSIVRAISTLKAQKDSKPGDLYSLALTEIQSNTGAKGIPEADAAKITGILKNHASTLAWQSLKWPLVLGGSVVALGATAVILKKMSKR